MATVDKNFRVKNGLNVAGTASFDSAVNVDNLVLNSAPLAYDSSTGRLKIQIDGAWKEIAFLADATEDLGALTFMDIGLAIDYDGQPVYTVFANGVNTTATKFADGGNYSTDVYSMTFDSGTIN
jgi:hypothetical protein